VILLDTNVISELMRPAPAAPVLAFMRAQKLPDLFTSSVCEAEIRYGIARMAAGRKREELAAAFAAFMAQGFGDRVLSFDSACAAGSATARIARETAGKPGSIPDALIAGTALAYGATIATRDLGGFAYCGIPLIDPWEAG
jgi:predicted nucleic acid-binding protein